LNRAYSSLVIAGVANGFRGAAEQGLVAKLDLIFSGRLPGDKAESVVLASFEKSRGRFAALVAINTSVINVKSSDDILWQSEVDVWHVNKAGLFASQRSLESELFQLHK
jgi:hypothetical protein